ncbi:MAG: RusA family crossover junction endodeoxyribonuclease [Porphyromonadaceae bacterium]|nr:RusA family crossover junction endodeoxyribonuclease [Porphyromonadaceae bacterium]
MRIEFEVLGEPSAQMRHKHFKRGTFSGTYDPSKDKKRDFLLTVQDKAPKEPLTGPIMITVVFYFGRPKNHFRTGKNSAMLRDDAPEWHISRRDTDNCIKFLQDSLNDIYWKDDSQICWIEAQKKYSERPRTHLIIQTL